MGCVAPYRVSKSALAVSMMSLPPSGIASRALTARFMMICSIWLASARILPRSSSHFIIGEMTAPIRRGMSTHFLDDFVQVHDARLEHLHPAEREKLPGE